MRKALALSVSVVVVAFAAPAGAQSAAGMGAMRYYVGTWSCVAGPIGRPPVKATATYSLDSGILREWVAVPVQGKMKKPYTISFAITYEAKHRRYVQATLDNDASWSISYAKPWTGNTEQWMDQSNDQGKPARSQTIRTNANSFAFTGYPTLTATKPNFTGMCHRSS